MTDLRWVLFLGALVICSQRAESQDKGLLTSAKTFRCRFSSGVSANMSTDRPAPKLNRDTLNLVFDEINTREGTARLIGNMGATDVRVIADPHAVTFLEQTLSGIVQITVIYAAQRSDGTFKAVHSRHTPIVGGNPLPSQAYGYCRALL
jgi:hypothetical protein